MEKEGQSLILISENQRTMTINPSKMMLPALRQILEYQIFTPERRRIIYSFPNYTDEITPDQLKNARDNWLLEDTCEFIKQKAEELSYANEIIIGRLDANS